MPKNKTQKPKAIDPEPIGFDHEFDTELTRLNRGAPIAIVTVVLHRATGIVTYDGSASTPMETLGMLSAASENAAIDYENANDLEEA